jgi:hypothetical protein
MIAPITFCATGSSQCSISDLSVELKQLIEAQIRSNEWPEKNLGKIQQDYGYPSCVR